MAVPTLNGDKLQEAISISRAELVLGQTEEIGHEEESCRQNRPEAIMNQHTSLMRTTVDKKSRHNKYRLARNRADEENSRLAARPTGAEQRRGRNGKRS